MKYLLLAIFGLFLAGCGDTRATHGEIQAPPPAPTTSAATEDLIAQRAALIAKADTDKARVAAAKAEERAAEAEKRAAKSDGDRALADAALAKAKADLAAAEKQAADDRASAKAVKGALADQQAAETAGKLSRFYVLAVLVGVLAAFLAYEGNRKGAAAAGVIAGALVVGATLVGWAVTHAGLVELVALLAGVALLLCHERSKLGVAIQAIEHLHMGTPILLAADHVKALLVSTYAKVMGFGASALAHAEAVLHLKHPLTAPIPLPTAATTTNRPTSPPAPPAQVVIP